jgi:hypothetical protein
VLDAVNRQDERGFEYFNRVIASTGLTLDNTVRCDKGRSAFKGSNLKEDAALRKILDEIAAGTIASGSILIVENLDPNFPARTKAGSSGPCSRDRQWR